MFRPRLILPIVLALLTAPPALCAEPDSAALELFENQIRPLLVEHCYKCHSSRGKELKASLSVETREGLLRGGDSGPALVPGKPGESLLLQALRYEDLEMPPDRKLSGDQIAAVAKWIELGAPDPRKAAEPGTNPGESGSDTKTDPARHWAFQPIRSVDPPANDDPSWNDSPIDRFVYAGLRGRGLQSNPRADRRTLIRRAYFDLLGLPPAYEDVERFVADESPGAYSRLIDRLLANPHYGERWGRYWLDIARYADTRGYNFESERGFPYAYTYRDYVIRSLNEDKPYDRFVLEQLAADQLGLAADDASWAGMGFLTVGRRFTRDHLTLDDRIDVVSRGFLGLTVGCARCHDHKYDPILMADYYGLYGVFASSAEPAELPAIGEPKESPEYEAYKKQLASFEKEIDAYRQKQLDAITHELRSRVADYLVHLAKTHPVHGEKNVLQRSGRGPLRARAIRKWQTFVDARRDDPLFRAWHELAALPREAFASAALGIIKSSDERTVQPQILAALRASPPASLTDVALAYGQAFERSYQAWSHSAQAGSEGETPDTALAEILISKDSPASPRMDELDGLVNVKQRNELRNLRKKVDALNVTSPGAPPRAMILVDKPQAHDARILLRGDPARQGDLVPRRFVRLLEEAVGYDRFQKGSGRLELAQAIIHPNNPLTARVLVNRVWQHHFGKGFVSTPSNFGILSNPPSHPELLDYLAAQFMKEGWSLKKLHRWIMLSQTYQQSSADREPARQIDPENRLCWKMAARRLDFEAMRDAILSVSGNLSGDVGGRSFDVIAQPNTPRRTVYARIDRYDLPRLFSVFDFANPDVTIPQRSETTIPQQALFMLNSPFMIEHADRLRRRTEAAGAGVEERINRLFQSVYARRASDDEQGWCKEYLGDGSNDTAWRDLAQALLISNEFLYID